MLWNRPGRRDALCAEPPAFAALREQTSMFDDIATHASPMQHIFQQQNTKAVAKYLRQSMILRTAILADSH
jgi:hypothetical protein